MRRSHGFTLIELMIVVAIIALLASIAIPNFLAFQCRAKQSEARSQLGSLFSVEKVFLSENNSYATDLVSLGWAPDGSPLYMYGWSSGVQYPTTGVAAVPTFNPALNNTLLPAVIGTPPRYQTQRTVDLNGAPFDPTADMPATACAGQSFIVAAVGDIKPDVTRGLDQWVIDQARYLAAPSNDCFNLL